MQEAFDKLRGVDIFSLKSYMEPTGFASFNGAWVLINELFVNFFFFILNAVVGFFSLLIRILEKIDLYSNYKNYVFNGAMNIWKGFIGSSSGGVAKQSLVSMLLLILAFYLFYQFFFSKGAFSRTLLHVFLVLILGFGYFGTIAGTSGGLYLLDTINHVSQDVTKNITNIKVEYGNNKSIKIGDSMADSYIAETSYKTYVFVNTGQENGKYKNSQDGKQETFDDSKVLGTGDKNGNFKAVKSKDRNKYLDELGNGANDDGEKNRWVSAMPDFIFTRMFYVIFKICEAFVLAIPVILIQMLNVIAQTLVLMMILLFPIVLLMSFVPRMQDLIFGVLKVMFGGLLFPAITSLLTLLVFYIEKMIENIVITGFDGILKTLPSLIIFGLVFKLLISVVSKGLVYFLLWKYKAELIQFILGSKARMVANDIGNKVEKGVTKTREVASQVPSRSLSSAQHLGNFALAGAGFGAGMMMNAKSHFQNVGSFFTNKESEHQPDEVLPTETLETPTSPDAPEPRIPKTKTIPEKVKPVEEKTPTPSMESPITAEPTSSSNEEFQTLKEEWISPFKQLRINSIERKLEEYKDPQAMYKAQGSNAFTRAYRKTMTRDDKLRANIERRDRLTERLKQLRGE
ncbi:conjugal transfer protein [Streptococcus parasanguinis]|uniref:conjugal transfer protein n=1 Tax=Streptococcus parasanguinis TaxID=1318 RepID=UPI00232CF090|nr:conjugal transfer protein [Streptococcus parasanguinis]MDB8616844.1 conjugal transfer protein [Streptococcus parasanguinis]MDB8624333.1 conjugal transfer protein [Streptococcus parasanguinis]